MKKLALPLLLLSLTHAACKRGDSEVRRDPAPPAPTAEPSPAPNASASAPASSQPASAPVAAPPPAHIADATVALHVVAEDVREVAEIVPWNQLPSDVPRPFYLHPLRDRVLVTFKDTTIYALADGKLTEEDGIPPYRLRLSASTSELPFMASDVDIVSIVGRWPSDVWIRVGGLFSDGARLNNFGSALYRKQGDRFVEVPLPVEATAWTQGRTLVLSGDQFSLAQPSATELPRRAAGAKRPVRIQAEAMTALPDGEVLVVGRDGDENDRLAVERWAPGRADSTVIPLPPWDGKLLRAMVLATERDRYVLARFEATSSLARIDVAEAGATAVPLSLPSNKPVTDAALAADGSLWILLGDGDGVELFRRNKEGAYTRATFPKGQGLSPTGMAAASADVVYLAGSTSNVRSVILSSRPGKLSFPSEETGAGGPDAGAPTAPSGGAQDAGAASAPPAALSSSCASPFVILFAVSKSAPADYDYPATRDALSGWADGSKYRFIEYSHRGQRMLGASAPDAARAEALAARLRERVKGASPAVACFSPAEVLREVRLASTP
ncbi:hypothetical protein WME90_18315 [Sorangium sp. So ce375]|uniref:hypothetical protein n=1 Tax=Sorangium sp. So ce375 TaxID=3133306 RepID=UPI003F5AECA2